VPKTPSEGYHAPSGHSSSGSDDGYDDDGEDAVHVSFSNSNRPKTFMQGCVESDYQIHDLGALVALAVFVPIRIGFCGVADGLWISHRQLFVGSADLSAWPEGRWRFGAGFGTGALFLPGLAGGMPFALNAEATGEFSTHLQLRLRAGTFGSLLAPAVDFQRPVFVDGKAVGTQRDETLAYSQSGYPLFADVLFPVGENGFYLAGGAGAVFLKESLSYLRHSDYGPADEVHEEARRATLPAASLALGRYGGGGHGHPFWRFEIRYQALLNGPTHMSSFPGDNAQVTHMLGWDWAWLW
jgi:hypothetical protein